MVPFWCTIFLIDLLLCTVHPVPDLHIEGSLSAIHVMLDKPQLDLLKGLVGMNLGEGIEDFEKPSTVIRDPIAAVSGGKEGRRMGDQLIFAITLSPSR